MEGWRLSLALVVGVGLAAFLFGAYYYSRRMHRVGGVIMGLALLGVAVGAGLVVVPALEHAEEAVPRAAGLEMFQACQRRHFLDDDGVLCGCANDAFEAVRAEHPGVRLIERERELVIEGPSEAVGVFHTQLGECAAPRLVGWVIEQCRADCGAADQACRQRCQCVARAVRGDRRPEQVARLFVHPPGPAPTRAYEDALLRAQRACRSPDEAPVPRGFEEPSGNM